MRRYAPGSTVFGAGLAVVLMLSLLAIVIPTSATPRADAAVVGQAARYISISPVRVFDTRDPGFSRLLSRGIVSVDPLTPSVIAAAGVNPLDVEAVAINLTIASPQSFGHLKSWPTTEPTPPRESASTVNNQSAGEDIANFAIVPVGANGRISIQAANATDVIVDVQGVFERSTASRAGRFVPLAKPQRALDTRGATPVAGKTSVVVDLAATVGVPRTASSAVINMVATRTQEPGYLTAYPGGSRPRASNVNYPGGQHDVAGSAITQLDNGKLAIYANGTTDLVVDVIGYMTGDSDATSSTGLFVGFAPERHYDSRSSKAPLGTAALNGNSHLLHVAGALSVPSTGVLAVASNLTMTNTNGAGNLVAYPGTSRPSNYSTVNAVFNHHTIANHAIVALNNGAFSVFSPRYSDFIVDISGYFLDGTTTPPEAPRRTANPDVVQAPVEKPTLDNDYEYLQLAQGGNSSFGAYERGGRRYYGWNPCRSITYAINRNGASNAQMAALQAAVYDVEEASGFDLVYVGEATGSLDVRVRSSAIDSRLVGGGNAMAVFGFSDPTKTPILAGGTIGIGGLGSGVDSRFSIEHAPGDPYAWIVRNGFAIADMSELSNPDHVRATFAHEIGHMIGLDHVSASGELMQPSLTARYRFGNGDKYGLWSIGADPCAASRQLSHRALGAEPVGIDIGDGNWVID